MALDYHDNNRMTAVLEAQDAYTFWYTEFLSKVLTGQGDAASQLPRPPLFMDALNDKVIELSPEERLQTVNDASRTLYAAADQLLQDVKTGSGEQALKDAENLRESFSAFSEEARQFRHYIYMEMRGFDEFTGLKNRRRMHKELHMEMERLSRKGQPFTMALATIDDYEDIKAALGEDKARQCILVACEAMVACLRPFDDAYYASENEFILCIKQTSVNGAMRAFNRFEEFFERKTSEYQINGENKQMSMSCCVAEPVAGDKVEDLLKNLREDIGSIEKTQGNAFTYQEMSPLQRYIKSQ